MILRIATRKSQLALAQSRWVKAQLEALQPGLTVELREYTTRGDQIQNVPLSQVGGKGLFTKEIEDALLAGEADIAVHSLKDLPAELPEGLALAAVPVREDPRDALVLPSSVSRNTSGEDADSPPHPSSLILQPLPHGARVGSSSFRRSAQLCGVRPDLRVESVRGNVDTRLRKLDEGQYHALVLAAAGLRRLGLESRISAALPVELSTPAPGQGALGLETRADDPTVRELLSRIEDADTRAAVAAERTVMDALGGGCSIPLGAFARVAGDSLELFGMIATTDGDRLLRCVESGPASDPEALGRRVAERLREQGADEILAGLRG